MATTGNGKPTRTGRGVAAVALVMALLVGGATRVSGPEATLPGGAAEQAIYEVLTPHGDWLSVKPYGEVWRPFVEAVGRDFTPYARDGRWIYTERGWSFDSVTEWGWLPFHFGRWAVVPDTGWVWVPDTRWSPAWVDWRSGGGYVGWAPLPPGATVAGGLSAGWTFVEERFFVDPWVTYYAVPSIVLPYVHRVSRPERVVVRGFGHAWYRGPSPRRIAAAAGVPIAPAPAPSRGRSPP